MYKPSKPTRTTIARNDRRTGEDIIDKMVRILTTQEGIQDEEMAPMLYTQRSQGVVADYDIRTDKMEIAVEAMGNVAKTEISKRRSVLEAKKKAEEKDAADKAATDNPGNPES